MHPDGQVQAAPLILSGLPAYQGAVFHYANRRTPDIWIPPNRCNGRKLLDGVEGVLRISIDNTRKAR